MPFLASTLVIFAVGGWKGDWKRRGKRCGREGKEREVDGRGRSDREVHGLSLGVLSRGAD